MSRRWRLSKPLRRGRFFRLPVNPTQIISPPGIPSAEAFGVPLVNDGVIRPPGIPSAEAFGTPTITAGPVTVSPPGIPTVEAFGTPVVTITFDLTKLAPPAKHTSGYLLVAVARIPQPSGPPLFIEMDPIAWSGVGWSEELSRAQTLDVSCLIGSLPDSITQRLGDLKRHPTELWLFRDGRLVCAGPLISWNTQSQTITLHATGLLGYLRFMFVWQDLVFSQVDQFTIVKTLIDHWQNSPYGDFGIDTSDVGVSGMLRDHTYKMTELHQISKRVEELGKRENGFDIAVDPATRALQLWYPRQGTDRSSGEDAIVFDALSITSNDVACSAAPGDIASDAFGTGTGTPGTAYSTQFDAETRAQFGRAGVAASFDGVSVQTTLDDHVQGLLNARTETLLIPGPSLRVRPEADLPSYGVGDTVQFQLHARLGVTGTFRIRKRTVSVSGKTGVENVTLEFV